MQVITRTLFRLIALFYLTAISVLCLPVPQPEDGQGVSITTVNNAWGEDEQQQQTQPNNSDDPQHIVFSQEGTINDPEIIYNVETFPDGNWKIKVKFHGKTIPLSMQNIVVGKCTNTSPGLSILNDNMVTEMMIDMNMCALQCDYDQTRHAQDIEILNEPLKISFDVYDKFTPVSQHVFFVRTQYFANYVVGYEVSTSNVVQAALLDDNTAMDVPDNIQFAVRSFVPEVEDEEGEVEGEIESEFDDSYDHLEIFTTNGFAYEKMVTVPQYCYIQFDSTDPYLDRPEQVYTLWNLSVPENPEDKVCTKNLTFQLEKASWKFNFNKVDYFLNTLGLDYVPEYKLACQMRVCANINGNDCAGMIRQCDYRI